MLAARIIRPESVHVSAQSHLPADGISTTHPTPLQLKFRIRSIQSPSGAGGGGGGADSVPTFPLPVPAHQRRLAAASLDTVASFQPFAKTKRNAATALKENNKIWKNKKRMARDFSFVKLLPLFLFRRAIQSMAPAPSLIVQIRFECADIPSAASRALMEPINTTNTTETTRRRGRKSIPSLNLNLYHYFSHSVTFPSSSSSSSSSQPPGARKDGTTDMRNDPVKLK